MPAAETDLSPFKFTYEDYCQFPDDGRRHEVLDGMHVVSPAPQRRHQALVVELTRQLANHLVDHPLGEVYSAPFDVLLGPHDILQPDLVFVAGENLEVLNDANIRGVPDLVVEILSTHKTRDTVQKRARYQAAGVPEYWLVDPDEEAVTVLRLDAGGEYQTALHLDAATGGQLESPLLPGLQLDVGELFRH